MAIIVLAQNEVEEAGFSPMDTILVVSTLRRRMTTNMMVTMMSSSSNSTMKAMVCNWIGRTSIISRSRVATTAESKVWMEVEVNSQMKCTRTTPTCTPMHREWFVSKTRKTPMLILLYMSHPATIKATIQQAKVLLHTKTTTQLIRHLQRMYESTMNYLLCWVLRPQQQRNQTMMHLFHSIATVVITTTEMISTTTSSHMATKAPMPTKILQTATTPSWQASVNDKRR
mmetsp:Transcript_16982/g.36838  ORF Transcript_16982/g.36838 Transcript_16982/m.36838 type:complete len:228 (-) Transcript_16982:327-1010(-)